MVVQVATTNTPRVPVAAVQIAQGCHSHVPPSPLHFEIHGSMPVRISPLVSMAFLQVTYELKHRRGQLQGPEQAPKNQGYSKVAHADAVPMDEMNRN